MMYEPTLLSTQGIFNLSHHIGMVWEELAFDDAVSYTASVTYGRQLFILRA